MIDINLKPKVGRIEAGVLIQCIDKDGVIIINIV